MAKKRQLKTVQRIQLSGKSWEKLGTHFTILMADKDTQDVCTCTCIIVQIGIHYLYRLMAVNLHPQ